MKNILLSIFFTLTTIGSFAQSVKKQKDTSLNQQSSVVQYRLFPTQSIRIFIKLNTRNGLMWLVQFGTDSDSRLVASLNSDSLVNAKEEVNDRFTLYPTQNVYTFILLDQIDGQTWQVQWSTDPKERLIIPIE